MDDDDIQQFCLRWHNHQSSLMGALGAMLASGALADVTLSASGATVRAHRLVLASCSQYFAQLFKEVEPHSSLVVVLGCDAAELRLLLTFMYTGEVTASKRALPSLLRLAQTLQVCGLSDADANSTLTTKEPHAEESSSPINLELKPAPPSSSPDNSCSNKPDTDNLEVKEQYAMEFFERNEKDRLSKLDQIVQNLYTNKIGHPTVASNFTQPMTSIAESEPYERKYRSSSSVCAICNKRLSNQYNLRVHMETHAGRRHACRACAHVSRSRDALRKHVAYRHARTDLADF